MFTQNITSDMITQNNTLAKMTNVLIDDLSNYLNTSEGDILNEISLLLINEFNISNYRVEKRMENYNVVETIEGYLLVADNGVEMWDVFDEDQISLEKLSVFADFLKRTPDFVS